MDRIYNQLIEDHFARYNQMVFLSGPRQVGKTTISQHASPADKPACFFDWDNDADRDIILQGVDAVAAHCHLATADSVKTRITFDEIHKFADWKNFLKGFFDKYKRRTQIVAAGSAKMDIYQRGGDSLMGRYFPYHVYPISVAECVNTQFDEIILHDPEELDWQDYQALLLYGGFPDPFLRRQKRFSHVWSKTRRNQLFREDLRDLTRIMHIDKMELLATFLTHQAGQLITFSELAKKIRVSITTIQDWISVLGNFYYSFLIHPWSKNLPRALIKQPKCYLWDWSMLQDSGARAENFIAVHLKKAVAFWNDAGLGDFGLFFLRDKDQQEVDFLLTREQAPWILIEVKSSSRAKLSSTLAYYQQKLSAPYAFQVAIDMPYKPIDCFQYHEPTIVPAITLLSQLV